MPTTREKMLLPMLAVAAGGYATGAEAQTYQTYNITPAPQGVGFGQIAVTIGSAATAQYNYSYKAPVSQGPKPPKTKSESGPRQYS
ncbi:MAG: hypothetical protein V4659_12625, partial [Pseudomonadota bacterium]